MQGTVQARSRACLQDHCYIGCKQIKADGRRVEGFLVGKSPASVVSGRFSLLIRRNSATSPEFLGLMSIPKPFSEAGGFPSALMCRCQRPVQCCTITKQRRKKLISKSIFLFGLAAFTAEAVLLQNPGSSFSTEYTLSSRGIAKPRQFEWSLAPKPVTCLGVCKQRSIWLGIYKVISGFSMSSQQSSIASLQS